MRLYRFAAASGYLICGSAALAADKTVHDMVFR